MPAGMVRPRPSLVAPLGPAALAAYAAAGWRVGNGHPDTGQTVGPCARCRSPTVRYGPHGRPLCPDCRHPDREGAQATMELRSHLPKALLRNAISHAQRGWRVFPLAPGSKVPAVKAWETRATTDPDRIVRCWSAGPYNIGIACGPSRLVVVDLDVPKPGQTPPPESADPDRPLRHGADVFAALADRHRADPDPDPGDTYTVATGRGGTHRYYQHPADGPELRNTQGGRGGLGWLVDTRAHGGYVVAAGSVVAGRPYTTTVDTDPAILPAWLAAVLAPAPLPAQRPAPVVLPADRAGSYLRAAIDRETALVAQAAQGVRNHVLYTAAVALGQLVAGGALAEADAVTVLTAAAGRAGLRRAETTRTIRSGLRAGARRPRTLADAA